MDIDVVRAVLEGRAQALPSDFVMIDPVTPRAVALLREIGVEEVLRANEAFSAGKLGGSAFGLLNALLQQAAYDATVSRDSEAKVLYLEHLLVLRPDVIEFKEALLPTLLELGLYDRAIDLFSPELLTRADFWNRSAPLLASVVVAAFRARRFTIVREIARAKGTSNFPVVEADVICRRVALLDAMHISTERWNLLSSELDGALQETILALDEYALSDALKKAEALAAQTLSQPDIRLVLGVAGVAAHEGWGRPYRDALRLAAGWLRQTGAVSEARDQWAKSKLPEKAFESFLLLSACDEIGDPRKDLIKEQPEWREARLRENLAFGEDEQTAFREAFLKFTAAPSLETAQHVWSKAYLSGRFADLGRAAPISMDATESAARARTMSTVPLPDGVKAPLWLFMTWHSGSDRLLQTLAAYAGDATIVVSVGGDARPPGFARVTAALFCRNLHLLARPTVAWGDQKCLFHNLFHVMQSFRAQSSPDSWMQVVCDRTYPIKSLRRLSVWTGEGRIVRTGAGPNAWKVEWPADVADNISRVYAEAMDEAFSTGRPSQFVELATKSPLFGDNDMRLPGNIFNFSDKALSIAGSWHKCMVSPFEADVRWMSFSRLQEYVDVATESMATYSRRMHPATMRWVHGVLAKYDLRTGDPWVYISRKYVDRVLDDPGIDELFSAMNLGFGPEMNFFDTVAVSFKLDDDFIHPYNRPPSTADEFIPQVCAGADRNGQAFVRKTDPIAGRKFIEFFADRVLEEHAADGLHWVVAAGDFADDDREARPQIDAALMGRFIGARVKLRDMLSRRSEDARFEDGRIIAEADGRILATWQFVDDVLTVHYADPAFGTKCYKRPAGDARLFTLAPSELVGIFNGWSMFLDFDLEDLRTDLDVGRLGWGRGMQVLLQPGHWLAAGTADAAILCAFADTSRADFPTPSVIAKGAVHDLREVDGVPVALCSLDGFPALMQVAGSAQTRDRTAVHLKSASALQAAEWKDSPHWVAQDVLAKEDIVGVWTIRVLESSFDIRFDRSGWIFDNDGVRLGRWFVRTEGLQILGLDVLRMGLADHFRVEMGVWRLSGWGWRNLKDAVTFSLEQHPRSGHA